jgi:putative radical SAM enzyme (TIGR03279 family)
MPVRQSMPVVVAVTPNSPAEAAGVLAGDEILSIDGTVPRDIIEWRLLTDAADIELEFRRGGIDRIVSIAKGEGQPLGTEIASALFDRVRTCDNHCPFCFIYQLPTGLRKSLYLKDDDYRLSFLYGNFTTLTRFTEADLERVVTEGLSPLNVSIHATDPEVRSRLLRNKRGGMSLRWLRALLDNGVTVNGQIVVCPGVNDGAVFEDTMIGILDRFPELDHVAVVPLGVSKFNPEAEMRPHDKDEARAIVEAIREWQHIFLGALGRRMVFASDEYYLMAEVPFPDGEEYEGFPMHEDGVGMARTFEWEFTGRLAEPTGPQSGFFAWVDGAPAAGYRAPRNPAGDTGLRGGCAPVSTNVSLRRRVGARAPIGILTGEYGAMVLAPLLDQAGFEHARILTVRNEFFGGNTSVTGLMVGADIDRTLAVEPDGDRYLLPDVCLSEGRFLDGLTPQDLCRPVEVVPTDGIALRRVLEEAR